jgi:hypothetical protein
MYCTGTYCTGTYCTGDETYEDETYGERILRGRNVRGRNVRGHNVPGRNVPVPYFTRVWFYYRLIFLQSRAVMSVKQCSTLIGNAKECYLILVSKTKCRLRSMIPETNGQKEEGVLDVQQGF